MNLYDEDGKIQFEKDVLAARQYFLEHVNQNTVFISRDEDGRVRRRIIVTPRSYLDGGTEVLPGQRKFNFSDAQPYWSPIDVLGPGKTYDRQPLNPRWEQGWTRLNWN